MRLVNNRLIPAEKWQKETIKAGETLIRKLLKGFGDESRERMFRMCMSLCFHRALTDEEFAGLPGWFTSYKPTDFAGGPLQTYFTKGIPDVPTIEPCRNPQKRYMDMTLETYLIDDCGECRPCKARLAMQQFIEDLPWPMPEKEFYRRVEGYARRLARVDDIIVVER